MDRVKGFAVVLDSTYQEQDLEHVKAALAMVKGVAAVQPIEATNHDVWARLRLRTEMKDRLHKTIDQLFVNEWE